MDTKETPATQAAEAAAPPREPGDICASATQRTFLTQEEIALAQTGHSSQRVKCRNGRPLSTWPTETSMMRSFMMGHC